MMAGIYYGAKYGGSTTSILLNIPGESSSVATCIDGYQMARKGRAGAALGISAIASFIAGTVGVVLLTVMAPPVAAFALSFSSPEYFALMVLGLALVVLLSGPSLPKGLLALLLGLWLTSIGTDIFTAQSRFIFGKAELLGGIDFTVVAIGVFALGEVLSSIDAGEESKLLPVPKGLRNLLPTWQDMKDCRFAFLNGSIIGFIIGVLPGAGGTIASFISYGLEKAVSKHPEKFGTGVIEGVAAPEGANNADTGGALVPLLTLGIPGGSSTAILLSALIIWGIRPGPLMMTEHPDIFWGLVASFWIGNIMLVLLNVPLIGIWVKLLTIPYKYLYPSALFFVSIGVYAANNDMFQVGETVVIGILGYVLLRLGFHPAPILLGFVLGPRFEENFRRAMLISRGDIAVFVERPISVVFIGLCVLLIVLQIYVRLRGPKNAIVTPPVLETAE